MTPGMLLLLAAVSMAAGAILGPRFMRTWLALTLTGIICSFGAALLPLCGNTEWEWTSVFLVGGEPLHFRLDALNALFLVLLSVAGGAGAVFAREYWSGQEHPDCAPRGRSFWWGLLFSMGFALGV